MNESLTKISLLLNGAGDASFNPIVIGNDFNLVLNFNTFISSISGNLWNEDKSESLPFTFTKITDTLYKVAIIVGTSPFIYYSKTFFRINIIKLSENFLLERICYFSEDSSDAVWIFNTNTQSFEKALNNYSQICTENCAIQIFPNIKNEFGIHTYGGFQYFSVFDANTNEDAFEENMVRRIYKQKIENFSQIYLVKKTIGEPENHHIKIRFRTSENSETYLEKEIKIKSISCYGFLIQYPEIS